MSRSGFVGQQQLTETIELANKILGDTRIDPDSDRSMLARQLLRCLDRNAEFSILCAQTHEHLDEVVQGRDRSEKRNIRLIVALQEIIHQAKAHGEDLSIDWVQRECKLAIAENQG